MENSIEMLLGLVCLMLVTSYFYRNNYYLQGFWIIAISWFGVKTMIELSVIEFPLILIIFTIIVNIFLIEEAKIIKTNKR